MYPEAKGVLDLVARRRQAGLEDPVALIVHSVASSLMGRPEVGLKDLANPAIGTNYDSQLWKALAFARQGKWAEAREKFKNVEFAITSLPIDLQRIVIADAMRASLEVKDYSGAAKRSSDLDVVGIPPELKPAISVLRGRLAEALGHDKDALDEYKSAMASSDRAAAAEAKLLDDRAAAEAQRNQPGRCVARTGNAVGDVARRRRSRSRRCKCWRGSIPKPAATANRFAAARTATRLQPNSEASRQGQDACGGAVRATLPQPQGRRSSAGRRARDVLRIPRIDADRPARRRNDPPPRGPAGRGRSARPGQRAAAVPGRPAAGGRGARAGRGAAGDGLSDQPQAGSRHRGAAHHADRRSFRRTAPAAAVAGGARAKRRRPP